MTKYTYHVGPTGLVVTYSKCKHLETETIIKLGQKEKVTKCFLCGTILEMEYE